MSHCVKALPRTLPEHVLAKREINATKAEIIKLMKIPQKKPADEQRIVTLFSRLDSLYSERARRIRIID
jgi:hypothetical protein